MEITNDVLSALVEINLGLLGVSITVVAFAPALVEIVRVKSSSFLATEGARRLLSRSFSIIGYTIWLFGISLLLLMINYLYEWKPIELVSLIMTLVGTFIVVLASYRIAKIAITLI